LEAFEEEFVTIDRDLKISLLMICLRKQTFNYILALLKTVKYSTEIKIINTKYTFKDQVLVV